MNVNLLKMGKTWLLVFLFLIVGVTSAQADFQLADDLTVYGFLRQTCVINTGTGNPNLLDASVFPMAVQSDKNRLHLMRTMLQFEFDYHPTDVFKVYTKMRAIHDQTELLNSKLNDYDAMPWGPRHGSDMISGHGEEHFQADIWEFWANYEGDNLWVRLGKQQIAWGDLPGLRIADKVNPLDLSWHLTFEPEEFENVRIPEWALRVYYTLPETISGPFDELFIDAYINPGDVKPDMQPATGSPYDNGWKSWVTSSSSAGIDHLDDNRGETEWGARIGFNLGNLAASFNYLSIHYHTPIWDYTVDNSIAGWASSIEFPEIDMYATTLSYALPQPFNTSITFEGSYTPDHPWQTAGSAPGPFGTYRGEATLYRAAIYLERNVFFMNSISRFFFPGKLAFLYYRHHISSGESVKINWAPGSPNEANELDWDMDQFYLSYTLPFGQGAMFEINPTVNYITEGAYRIKCFLKCQPNYDWRFDIGAAWLGGSGDKHFMNYDVYNWQDEVYARITYMF